MSKLQVAALETWRQKASSHTNSDRIGHLIARSFELISTVVRDGVDAESVSLLVDTLPHEQALIIARDNNAPSPPIHAPRELVHGLVESLAVMIRDIIEKRPERIGDVVNKEMVEELQHDQNADAEEMLSQACIVKDEDVAVQRDENADQEGLLPELGNFVAKEEDMFGNLDDDTGGDDLVENQEQVDLINLDHTPIALFAKEDTNDEHDIDGMMDEKDETPEEEEAMETEQAISETELDTKKDSSVIYRCDTCNKVLCSKWSLRHHVMSIHHKSTRKNRKRKAEKSQLSKKFPCGLCKYSFDRQNKLNDHMNVHTGQRPYKCSKCSAHFRASTGLRVHLRNAHGVPPLARIPGQNNGTLMQ